MLAGALIRMTDEAIDSRGSVLNVFDSRRTRRLAAAGRGFLRYGLVALLLLWLMKDIILLGAALYTAAEALEASEAKKRWKRA